MNPLSLQDVAAALTSIITVGGVVVLAVIDHEVPPSLTLVLGSAITWLFVRSAQVAETKTNGHHG